MTRQHFKAIADALKDQRPMPDWDANKRMQWNMDVKAMASVCLRFNAGFRRERFLSACGELFDV